MTIKIRLSEKEWSFTPSEWELYVAGFRRTQTLILTSQFLIGLIVTLVDMALSVYHASGGRVRMRDLRWDEKAIVTFFISSGVAACGFNLLSLRMAMRRYSWNFYMHVEEGRQYLREEVAALESKYGSMIEKIGDDTSQLE